MYKRKRDIQREREEERKIEREREGDTHTERERGRIFIGRSRVLCKTMAGACLRLRGQECFWRERERAREREREKERQIERQRERESVCV